MTAATIKIGWFVYCKYRKCRMMKKKMHYVPNFDFIINDEDFMINNLAVNFSFHDGISVPIIDQYAALKITVLNVKLEVFQSYG